MSLIMYGKGKGYVDGKMEFKNGKYILCNATVIIGDKGIESISDGNWVKIE